MDERRRVVITGMGSVNASVAGGTQAVAGALARRQTPIAAVRGFSTTGLGCGLAAQVDERILGELVDRDQARRLSRICQFTVAAAALAVRDAGVSGGPELGIAVGTEHGDFRSSEEFATGFLRRGPTGLSALVFPNTVMNTMASVAAIAVAAKGPSITLNQSTIAGDLAVARAAALIRAGRAEAMVAGGADEICEIVYRRLAGMRALSPLLGGGVEGCRPHELGHNGAVLGEGATFVVLESQASARARGAAVLAEVTEEAWGSVPASPHGASPRRRDDGSPAARLIRRRSARTPCPRRCYGSGNGDPRLDDWEEALLDGELPDRDGSVPLLSLAPLFGQHGGLGALRIAAAALDARGGTGPVLVHGIARGGCRTALVIEEPGPGSPP